MATPRSARSFDHPDRATSARSNAANRAALPATEAGLASTQRLAVIRRGETADARLRPRSDAWPPRRPSQAELADTVKYELIDPSDALAGDTLVGMDLPPPVRCRRRIQLGAVMVAMVACAIASYVTILS